MRQLTQFGYDAKV